MQDFGMKMRFLNGIIENQIIELILSGYRIKEYKIGRNPNY